MIGLTVALALQVSLVAAQEQSYTDAYHEAKSTGRPLVVLVGADWCPACQRMKRDVLPQAARQGVLSKVAFTSVNTDRQSKLARKLMRGGSIPQLVVYWETRDGWRSRRFVGTQSVKAIESVVDEALSDAVLQVSSTTSDDEANTMD